MCSLGLVISACSLGLGICVCAAWVWAFLCAAWVWAFVCAAWVWAFVCAAWVWALCRGGRAGVRGRVTGRALVCACAVPVCVLLCALTGINAMHRARGSDRWHPRAQPDASTAAPTAAATPTAPALPVKPSSASWSIARTSQEALSELKLSMHRAVHLASYLRPSLPWSQTWPRNG